MLEFHPRLLSGSRKVLVGRWARSVIEIFRTMILWRFYSPKAEHRASEGSSSRREPTHCGHWVEGFCTDRVKLVKLPSSSSLEKLQAYFRGWDRFFRLERWRSRLSGMRSPGSWLIFSSIIVGMSNLNLESKYRNQPATLAYV